MGSSWEGNSCKFVSTVLVCLYLEFLSVLRKHASTFILEIVSPKKAVFQWGGGHFSKMIFLNAILCLNESREHFVIV